MRDDVIVGLRIGHATLDKVDSVKTFREDESSDSSDCAYKGRAKVQPRRVQPRRA